MIKNELEKLISDKSACIGVIGLGYVGLPLIVEFGLKGFRGIGFEVDEKKANDINAGRSYIVDVPNETPAAAFDRAYGAVGSPWMSAGTRAAIQDYANRASSKASKDRIGRQVMLRTLMLAGPDAQVM